MWLNNQHTSNRIAPLCRAIHLGVTKTYGYVAISIFVILTFLHPSGSEAQKVEWEEAIRRVEISAKKYSDYASNILGSRHVGPANDSIRFNVHRCAIIGRMLNKSEYIIHIEKFNYPNIDKSSDPFDLLVFSLTLENWVAAAQSALGMNIDQHVNVWNLECVGKLGIPATLFIEGKQPNAEFNVDGSTLFVYGDIEVGFFDRLKKELTDNPAVREVALGSGGGSVRDAMLAGYEIRRLGLSTTIFGPCYSACPLVFFGGAHRILWASPNRLGFHQVYSNEGGTVPADDPIYGLISRYMIAMGVNPQIVLPWMLSASPQEMFEPNVSDLCAPGAATFVQRVCGG